MAVKVAQASHSEYYKTGDPAWGMPPNQLRTGVSVSKPQGNLDGELNVMNWYRMSGNPWTVRFRAKNPAIREHIADLMEQIVANGSKVGYSQYNAQYPRTGLFDSLYTMAVPDPAQIKNGVNCDCSSMVGAAIYFAGIHDYKLRTMNTSTMESILDATLEFEKVKTGLDSTKGLIRGDILLARNGKLGHTCVVVSDDLSPVTEPYEILNCAHCNMRTGGSTKYKVIKVLDEKDIVGLISWDKDTGWGQVRSGAVIGYVSNKYLHKIDRYATVKKDAWLRAGAGTSCIGLKVVPKGTLLPVTGETKKVGLTLWYRAVYDGTAGWVSGNLLRVW